MESTGKDRYADVTVRMWSRFKAKARSTQRRKRLAGGIAVVTLMVSATSVINTVAGLFELPLSDWLGQVMAGYRALFYPMIDATIGRAWRLAGWSLTDRLRDMIVLYSMGYAACYRAIHQLESEKASKPHDAPKYLQTRIAIFSIFWPILVLAAASLAERLADTLEKVDQGNPQVTWIVTASGAFSREVMYVLAIVAITILLNAVGALN